MIGDKKIVALCLSRIHDVTCYRFVTRLNAMLREAGAALFVYSISEDLYWRDEYVNAETAVFDLIDPTVVDAVVIMEEKIKNKNITSDLKSIMARYEIPVVVVDAGYTDCYNVGFDYLDGFEKIVRHMIEEHKPKRPHFMAGVKDNGFSDARIDIFRRVMAENGREVTDDMISYGEFWSRPTAEAAKKLLQRPKRPDAIICANDAMAVQVIDTFKENGISVPEDVLVSGFDGVEEIFYTTPEVSSAICSFSALGEKTAEVVIDLLNDRPVAMTNLVKPELIIQESCGCKIRHQKGYGANEVIKSSFYRFQDYYRRYFEIAEDVQECETLEEAAKVFDSHRIYDMCFMINESCTNEAYNLSDHIKSRSFDENMVCLFNMASDEKFVPKSFHRAEIMPDLDRVLEYGCPLVFCAVDFKDTILGYACFFFRDGEYTDYYKLPQNVVALNTAIGGFVNMKYQRYLASQIESMYMLDSLTGLYNRVGFNRELRKLQKALGKGSEITVVLSDLDGLKAINDTYGHAEGDKAIRTVARALKNAGGDNALCVRFGGDEMMAVIPGSHSDEDVKAKINAYIDDYNAHARKEYDVSTSVGIYVTKMSEKLGFEQLLKKADELMYIEKQRKKLVKRPKKVK